MAAVREWVREIQVGRNRNTDSDMENEWVSRARGKGEREAGLEKLRSIHSYLHHLKFLSAPPAPFLSAPPAVLICTTCNSYLHHLQLLSAPTAPFLSAPPAIPICTTCNSYLHHLQFLPSVDQCQLVYCTKHHFPFSPVSQFNTHHILKSWHFYVHIVHILRPNVHQNVRIGELHIS